MQDFISKRRVPAKGAKNRILEDALIDVNDITQNPFAFEWNFKKLIRMKYKDETSCGFYQFLAPKHKGKLKPAQKTLYRYLWDTATLLEKGLEPFRKVVFIENKPASGSEQLLQDLKEEYRKIVTILKPSFSEGADGNFNEFYTNFKNKLNWILDGNIPKIFILELYPWELLNYMKSQKTLFKRYNWTKASNEIFSIINKVLKTKGSKQVFVVH